MTAPSHGEAVAEVLPIPGQDQLGPLVDAFDAAAERVLAPLRGHAATDRVFSTASHLGDFSLIWHLAGLGRGIAKGRLDQTIVLAALLGAESLIVNQGVKRLFRRERPTETGADRLRVRRPSTSAFPSGHASSAAFAATVLIGWDGRRLGLLWAAMAAVVGTSRAYVRIHHASDVVGGAVLGVGLGLLGRRLARRLVPS